MIKAVLDTNVFISALFWKGPPYDVVKAGLEGKFTLLTSVDILEELEERLKVKFQFPDADANEFLEIMTLNSFIVELKPELKVVDVDPSDNKIIECAVGGEAHFIVSGDRHLLDFREYKGIKIISPSEFLSILTQK